MAYELDADLYNYGQSGGGNLFISNTVSQAENFYGFNEDDLVIVAWSNVTREDRWLNGVWETPGNIYTQNIWPKQMLKVTDPIGCLIRDLGLIHGVKSLLERTECQWYFLSIGKITEDLAICHALDSVDLTDKQKFIHQTYEKVLKEIPPSFIEVLWQNDLEVKRKVNKEICPKLHDLHPFPNEHARYLDIIFPNFLSKRTMDAVEEKNHNLISKINELGDFNLYKIGDLLYDISFLQKSFKPKII